MGMESNSNDSRKRDGAAVGSAEDETSPVQPPAKQKRMLERELTLQHSLESLPPISPHPPDEFEDLRHLMHPQSPATKLFRPAVERDTKYIVVSGGVCSSLGKGVATSSIGALLRGHGFRVTAVKMDPYINIDAGLMSPLEHGEVYVLDDGGETDLDLGNYERMMFVSLHRDNNVTTGKIYNHVIEKERRGEYLGKTVQVVPHVTGEMVQWLSRVGQISADGTGLRPHICMIELGGTIGDIESMPFVEALRQLKFSLPENSLAWCHCSYVPNMSGQKTKPTQHSVKALLALGIQPDCLICRSSDPLEESTKKKLMNQCNIQSSRIFSCYDVKNLFHVPGVLAQQHIVGFLNGILHLHELDKSELPALTRDRNLKTPNDWINYASKVDEAEKQAEVVIAFVGKYNAGGGDAYQSVIAAMHHSAVAMNRKLKVEWIDAMDLEDVTSDKPEDHEKKKNAEARVLSAHGVFVPGGFGDRGFQGKARAAGMARKQKIPYLGVCLGFQVACIQFARDELGLTDATSEEFDRDKKSQNHVIVYMPEISKDTMGANMRLGSHWVDFHDPENSFASALYGGATRIQERHRHRYEFNTAYRGQMVQKGLRFTATSEDKARMDIIELPLTEHPFYLGVQYHPEYKSRPGSPSPAFYGFIAAACNPSGIKEVIEACKKKGPSSHFTPFSL